MAISSRAVCTPLLNSPGRLVAQTVRWSIEELTSSYQPRAIATPQRLSILHNENVRSKAEIKPLVLALWALWMIWGFGFHTLGARLWTQLDGTVTTARDIPPARGPRYATQYSLRGPDGKDSFYVAGPTDDSLPRSMPVGTSLKKQRWQLGYERDGQWVSDFGIVFYATVLTIAFGCLGLSFFLWRKSLETRLRV
jgi:hypothetical protein